VGNSPIHRQREMRSFGFLLAFRGVYLWWLFMLCGYSFALETNGLEISFAPPGWIIQGTFGAFFLAGCAGAFISLLMHPPKVPHQEKAEPGLKSQWPLH